MDSTLLKNLELEILQKQNSNAMHQAAIGNNNTQIIENNFRGDQIFWLDRKHNNLVENNFLDAIDLFIQYLNQTCYTNITSCEFHYAIYPIGSYYLKHVDQFKTNTNRAFSMIHYLNTNWQATDGGELQVHHTNKLQLVNPTYGKCVFFKSSELQHEVLITNKPRISITGWLKTG